VISEKKKIAGQFSLSGELKVESGE
jgi:hypothetical protein